MTQEEGPGAGLTKRVCLRLDNGTRIGCCASLGVKDEGRAARVDFVNGYAKGFVTQADLIRVSDIAGRLDAQRGAATVVPKERVEGRAKDSKRPRLHKPVPEMPDAWVQKATRVVDSLWRAKEAIAFKEPVRPTKDFVPDYFNVISNPMDLGTVREKLRTGQYTLLDEFIGDLNSIWSNAIKYNGASHVVGIQAAAMQEKCQAALAKPGFVPQSSVRTESTQVRSKRQTAGLAPHKWEPETLPEPSESKRSRGTRQNRQASAGAKIDKQEATSGPGPRGVFTASGRETLAAALEDESVNDAVLQQVSDIVAGHMVVGEDGSEELDLYVVPDELCWKIHDLLFPQTAPQYMPQVTGGHVIDDETDDD